MVSEGQFVGLDWNRIARLHSQVLVSTCAFFTLYTTGPRQITKRDTRFPITNKNYNFLDCDWFTKLLFSMNSPAKLLSGSFLWNSLISQ